MLAGAAIASTTDPLFGLKENVIIGKLIPAGSGIATYRAKKKTKVTLSELLDIDPDDEVALERLRGLEEEIEYAPEITPEVMQQLEQRAIAAQLAATMHPATDDMDEPDVDEDGVSDLEEDSDSVSEDADVEATAD